MNQNTSNTFAQPAAPNAHLPDVLELVRKCGFCLPAGSMKNADSKQGQKDRQLDSWLMDESPNAFGNKVIQNETC